MTEPKNSMQKKRLLLISALVLCLYTTQAVANEPDQAEASDYLEIDLARQINLVEQTQKLTDLIEELANIPVEVIEILLTSEKLNPDQDRIKAALVAFQNANKTEPLPEFGASNPPTFRTPKLTADNIGFAEVPRQGIPGTVIFEHEGKTYSAHPGESFNIRGKGYTIVSIKYLSAHQIEVSVKTKAGITHLQYNP